jgi:hypothetical protein
MQANRIRANQWRSANTERSGFRLKKKKEKKKEKKLL